MSQSSQESDNTVSYDDDDKGSWVITEDDNIVAVFQEAHEAKTHVIVANEDTNSINLLQLLAESQKYSGDFLFGRTKCDKGAFAMYHPEAVAALAAKRAADARRAKRAEAEAAGEKEPVKPRPGKRPRPETKDTSEPASSKRSRRMPTAAPTPLAD